MIKQTLLLIQLLTLICFSSLGFALTEQNSDNASPADPTNLLPTREQQEASLYVARSLSLSHYRKQNINRALSEQVYENYLDSLDRSRLYFISSDIQEFEVYRFRLDRSAISLGAKLKQTSYDLGLFDNVSRSDQQVSLNYNQDYSVSSNIQIYIDSNYIVNKSNVDYIDENYNYSQWTNSVGTRFSF